MAWIGALIMAAGSYAASDNASSKAGKYASSEAALRQRELTLAESQDNRANILFDQYLTNYLPKEQEWANRAFSDEESPEAAASRATTDVRAASAAREGSTMRNARSLGIDPSSGAYTAMRNSDTLADTALEVSARDQARRNASQTNFQRQGAVVQVGKGMPATAGQLTSQAQAGIGNLADAAGRRADQYNSLAGQAGNSFGNALGTLADSGMKAYRDYSANQRYGTGAGTRTDMPANDNNYINTNTGTSDEQERMWA